MQVQLLFQNLVTLVDEVMEEATKGNEDAESEDEVEFEENDEELGEDYEESSEEEDDGSSSDGFEEEEDLTTKIVSSKREISFSLSSFLLFYCFLFIVLQDTWHRYCWFPF